MLDEEFVEIAREVDEYNKGIIDIEKVLKTDINANSLIQYVNTSPKINDILEKLHTEYQFKFERRCRINFSISSDSTLSLYGIYLY